MDDLTRYRTALERIAAHKIDWSREILAQLYELQEEAERALGLLPPKDPPPSSEFPPADRRSGPEML